MRTVYKCSYCDFESNDVNSVKKHEEECLEKTKYERKTKIYNYLKEVGNKLNSYHEEDSEAFKEAVKDWLQEDTADNVEDFLMFLDESEDFKNEEGANKKKTKEEKNCKKDLDKKETNPFDFLYYWF